jgi:predicted GTPase
MADIVVVAKSNSASNNAIERVALTARELAPSAEIVRGFSIITLAEHEKVRGRRVLAIDDGPTLTHGGMAYGAGYLAAVEAGAGEIVDPRASAVGHIAAALMDYPHIGKVLPALGYSEAQLKDLAATINSSAAEVVVSGTPVDIARLIAIDKPVVRARYEFAEAGEPKLEGLIDAFLARLPQRSRGGA